MEQFFSSYVNTISALSTLGTWAAVAVSLWLALSFSKPKLRINVGKVRLIPGNPQPPKVNLSKCDEAIGVTFQNIGREVAYIDYYGFFWKLPWPFRAVMNHLPETDFRNQSPIKIEPGKSVTITLTSDLDKLKKEFRNLCKINKVPIFFRRFINLQIRTPDGTNYRTRLHKNLKELR